MSNSITAPLADSAKTTCPSCRAAIWLCSAEAGPIALDPAPGPYVVDGHGKVFLSDWGDGYRAHSCGQAHGLPFALGGVEDDEFLWF